jgi:hypothetical protein
LSHSASDFLLQSQYLKDIWMKDMCLFIFKTNCQIHNDGIVNWSSSKKQTAWPRWNVVSQSELSWATFSLF